MFETWEGEAIRIGQAVSGPNRLAFTVTSESLAREMASLAEQKAEVRIQFRQKPAWFFESASGGVFVTGYESLSPPGYIGEPGLHATAPRPVDATSADSKVGEGDTLGIEPDRRCETQDEC